LLVEHHAWLDRANMLVWLRSYGNIAYLWIYEVAETTRHSRQM
jgi:hypothetical protein